ncbi:MAG: condensation domain-containing protein, partial [Pyrinomonadaceae bacterium]
FFELGGDSILSIQIVTRAAQAGLRLTTKQLFQHQTVAELAAAAGRGEAAAAAEQGLVTGELPLTPIQHWFFGQEMADPHHYNQSVVLEPRGEVNVRLLERALSALLDQHDSLRLRFRRDAEGWRQRVDEGGEAVEVVRVDLSATVGAARREALEREADRVQASLDLERGPLVRAALFEFGGGDASKLLIAIHHHAVDAVSWRVLLEDLETAYEQLRRGEAVRLPAKTTSFKRWAEALARLGQDAETSGEVEYWEAALDGAETSLPLEESAGEDVQGDAAHVTAWLDEAETNRLLREVPGVYNTRINDVLLLALGRALGVWAAGGRVLVDVEGHGREEEAVQGVDLSRTVGWFTSLYPMALEVGSGEIGEELRALKERLRAVPRGGVGYGVLKYLGGAAARRRMGRLPRAQVSFNYLGQLDGALEREGMLAAAGESLGEPLSPRGRRSHLLGVNALVAGGRLRVSWTYGKRRHRCETIERLAESYVEELRAIIGHCLSEGAGGFTPSDFPLANLDAEKLRKLSALVDELDVESAQN